MYFEKARGIHGEDTAPFMAQLISDGENQKWEIQLFNDSNYEQTIKLRNEGLIQSEIAAKLELNKSTISRYVIRAKHEGRINSD